MSSNNNDKSFSLKKPTKNSLFVPPDAILAGNGKSVININVDKLKHYHNHPFKLYEGERLADMVESIKANDIMIPLLVRPLPPSDAANSDNSNEQQEYEVLAGHNRLESGKLAGLTEVPCIVRDDLTDEEAHLIVTESNLIQRSFSDLSHSERAEALAAHYNAIKHQGKRTDLIRQVEALINGDADMADTPDTPNVSASETNTPAGNRSIEVTGEKYGLSRNSVARYIRVNSLIAGFKELLDSEELSLRAGVSLSYISEARQQTILSQMQRYEVSISMKQAEQLKVLNTEINIDSDTDGESFILGVADILIGRITEEKESKPTAVIKFKLDRSAISLYFKEDNTEEEIQETVMAALEFYHQYRGQMDNSNNHDPQ